MGGVLLVILIAPGAIVVLLGLELLEHRLLESRPTAASGDHGGKIMSARSRTGALSP